MNGKALAAAICVGLTSQFTWSQSLEQAVATTIATDPELRSSFNEYMSYRQDIEAAKGDYLPDVNLGAGIGYEHVNNATTKANGDKDFDRKDANISLTQLIWDGSTGDNIDRTTYEAEAQRFQLLSDAEDKALRVTEVYVDVLKAEEVLALSEANMEIHNRILSDIRRRAESGIGSTADLSQVQARVARANTNLLSAQNNLQDAYSAFFRVVGEPADNPVKPQVDQTKLPSSLEQALGVAIDTNPVLKLARYDIEAAKSQHEQFKGSMYPTFTIEASQNWADEANGVNDRTDEFSAMLRVRYNLFNGGTDMANARRSAYQLNKSKDVFDNAYRLLEESTRLSWSAYELTEQQKMFLQQHVDSASDTVIAYEKQFRIGRRTLLDLLNTENELFEARRSYVDAYYGNVSAKYRLLNSTGGLLDALRVDVPNEWLTPVVGGGN